MSMTREEIIKEYENAVVASGLAAAAGNEDAAKSYELFKAGLSALRPVSLEKADDDDPVSQRLVNMAKNVVRSHTLERIEKVWRGEWIKKDGYTECSKCEYWYPSTEDEEEDDRNPFCPSCGAPLTDEAVEITMKRLEALKDADD